MDDVAGVIGGRLSFSSLIGWAASLFKSPRAFFRAMEKKGGYLTPCLYLASWSAASGVISFIVGFLRPMPAGLPGGRLAQLVSIPLSPVISLVFAFFMAAVLFVIWHLMGSKEDYQTSFRIWAFILGPVGAVSALLGVVPFLPMLTFFYIFYVVILASQEAHGLSAEKSWAVWGSLGALLAVFFILALLVGQAARSGRIPGVQIPSAPGALR